MRVTSETSHGRESGNVQRHLEEQQVPGALQHEERAMLLCEVLHLLGRFGTLLLIARLGYGTEPELTVKWRYPREGAQNQ